MATAMTVERMKARVIEEIDRRRDEVITIAQAIWSDPETGFKEFRTADRVKQQFQRMGLAYRDGLAVTGVKALLPGGAGPGPTVAILGELDSLAVSGHPACNPETGAVHACGHHAQIAAMLGAGIGLQPVLPDLSGRVVLFAVPAEEYIEVEYRLGLRREGKLEFLVGKAELIAKGEFDDIDMALIIHTSSVLGEAKFGVMGTSNGCFVKFIRYSGRAAHAGGAPHEGINALKAAMLGLAAIDANRETFKDDDHIRVHPIITRGGQAVSSVPADVRMETFVRGRTLEAIQDANRKVDRSLRAGALAMGAQVEIVTLPGYMPFTQDRGLNEVFCRNAAALVGQDKIITRGHSTGSTDMGDLSLLMPTCHPQVAGARGTGHGADYEVVDYEDAVITPAKAMALTTVDLLANGAREARRVKSEFKPAYTKEQYLHLMRSIVSEQRYAES